VKPTRSREGMSAKPRTSRARSADPLLLFELSKVQDSEIRTRMVSHLLNVDGGLAEKVAMGLGFRKMPKRAEPAQTAALHLLVRTDEPCRHR
jgi:hypothetical protein